MRLGGSLGRYVMAVLALAALPASAQRITATMRGAVTDPTGAVIAGAKVTVQNQDTGLTRSTTTNTVGLYALPELPVGSYRVTIEYQGFKTAVRTGIALNAADTRVVDVQLDTGDVTETISVEASALAVRTSGAEVAGLVTGTEARELPLNGRNFIQLTLLQPGVTAQEGLDTVRKGLQGGSDISVSGGSTTSNLWLVDGANNNDVGSNRTLLVYPSVDAVEEFKIQRNNYGAEFGQAAGGQVNLITRGGTNEFHGSAYYFARRDSLMSNFFFLERADQPKPPLKWDDFGGTFGGPIIKDKLHFFVSTEVNKDQQVSVRTAFVPTQAERNGDFSVSIPGCSQPAPIDPLTGRPFPGNRIPPNRISPGGQLFLQQYSLPNTAVSGGCNNWTQAVPTPVDWHQELVRLDYSVTDSTRLMLRYTQDSWKGDTLNLWGDDPWPVIASDWDQPSRSLVAQLTQNIGSRMVNTLTFSYSANKINVTRTGEDAELAERITAAIPTIYPLSAKLQGGVATPLNWGTGPYGNLWNQAPWTNNQDLFVLKDDFSAAFGRHFVKAGILGSYNKKNEQVQNTSQGEGVIFNGVAGYLDANGVFHEASTVTGNALADYLLGSTVWNTGERRDNKNMLGRWKDFEAYLSDSWKVSPRVTLDLGVRLSHLPPPYLEDLGMANFDPAAIDRSLVGDPCNGLVYPPGKNPCPALGFRGGREADNDALADTKALLFAPRLGFAWDVSGTGKTALRGGVGKFYLRERVTLAYNLGSNAPFVATTGLYRTVDQARDVRGTTGLGFGQASNGRELDLKTPHNWQWNVTVERELAKNTVVELSYVGSKGQDLTGHYDANQVPPGDNNGNGVADRLEYARTGSASLRPFGFLVGDNQIIINTHDRRSNYHALQTQVRSRFWRNSQVQLSYSLSRLRANDPLNNSSGGQNADAMLSDNSDPDVDYGPALIHRTHLFAASLLLGLPKLDDKSGFVKNVLGDWQFTSVVTAGSGVPVTVYSGGISGLAGTLGPSGTGRVDNNNNRPNLVEGQPCRANSSDPTQWLNPAAFTLNGFRLGSIGTSGRGVCEGPGYFQADVGIYKNIRLNDRATLQVRFEVFNVFNTVNFLTNGGNLNTGYGPQNVVFDTGNGSTATSIVSADPAGNFGYLNATRTPRQAQVGLRLTF